MAPRTQYVVDTGSLTHEQRVAVCHAVLRVTEREVAKFETDIPWSNEPTWPVDVRDAAVVLSALREPRRGESAQYRQTGVQKNDDPAVWDAFVLLAPFAFDASAWATDFVQVASFSDCAEVVVTRLTGAQVAALVAAVGPIPLVPAAQS